MSVHLQLASGPFRRPKEYNADIYSHVGEELTFFVKSLELIYCQVFALYMHSVTIPYLIK